MTDHRLKFVGLYQRERAAKMVELTRQGWTTQELADRFLLTRKSVQAIVLGWQQAKTHAAGKGEG